MYSTQEIDYQTSCKTNKKFSRDSNRDLNHLEYYEDENTDYEIYKVEESLGCRDLNDLCYSKTKILYL